jgi:preprotein translocase subunit SecG
LLAYLLYALFLLSCAVLIIVILLQPGKSDAGALFTSSVSSTAFGPRGTQSILAKITIGSAAAFLLIALALSQPALTGSHSVLQSESVPATSPQPSPSPSTAPAAASPQAAATSNPKPAEKPALPAATQEPKKSPEKKNK